ncbi:hypothetical protein MKEN_00891200 [Mycena kentingensis (nom. inval.)]|nr:hypothetical protein MKEN_00891200 [Mycena kentingensis (nom. inval.)]
MPPHQPRPSSAHISFKSLLSLPVRLCNPPPAAGKVRSCSVTPTLQVRLDDILERKHLPPLGLKDFEEWLLYCEDSVENLYFIIWLNEYKLRYQQWLAQAALERNNAGDYRMDWPVHFSSQLAMFYARAKQTFFTPNAAYELNVPSSHLAPFHSSTTSPHPDPVIFTPVAIETRKMLEQSLERWVAAQLSNVGMKRALCGMVAGVVFFLIGALIPLVYNFALGHSRWLRLTSLPGMWIGLTILLASLNGVCIGVYIFGDLRQLRKFELSRPAISKPQPLVGSRHTLSGPGFVPVVPVPQPLLAAPSPAHINSPRSVSRLSTSSGASSDSRSSCSGETGGIHVSPAYYDEDDVDGPATSPVSPDNLGIFVSAPPPSKEPLPLAAPEDDLGFDFSPTAAFIHPFDEFPQDDQFGGPPRILPEERQVLSPFDFDALPRYWSAPAPSQQQQRSRTPSRASLTLSAKALIGRMQSKCIGAPRWAPPPPPTNAITTPEEPAGATTAETEKPPHRGSVDSQAQAQGRPPNPDAPARPRLDKSAVEKQFKRVRAVPAFAVPLTPVLSSVVVRGQWEIVVRSALLAMLLCWVILASLLAIPPTTRR